jgi:hypothetical protein
MYLRFFTTVALAGCGAIVDTTEDPWNGPTDLSSPPCKVQAADADRIRGGEAIYDVGSLPRGTHHFMATLRVDGCDNRELVEIYEEDGFGPADMGNSDGDVTIFELHDGWVDLPIHIDILPGASSGDGFEVHCVIEGDAIVNPKAKLLTFRGEVQ